MEANHNSGLGNRDLNKSQESDRLIDFREVNRMIGSRCKTSHTALALARRGQIRAVRINDRIIKYSRASVLRLIAGNVDPVSTKLPE